MSYDIRAFVAAKGTFSHLRQLSPYVTVAPLNQDFELVIYDEYLDSALQFVDSPLSEEHKDLGLSKNILEWVSELSQKTYVVFINAHFFGGNGSQSAVLWQNGKLILNPATNGMMMGAYYGHLKESDTPINSVLRELGVKVTPPEDEFEAVGLKKYRHNEDWFAAYTGLSSREYEPFESTHPKI